MLQLNLTNALSQEQLLAFAAAHRWKIEQGGTYLDGVPLRTDDVTQNKMLGAIKLLENQPVGTAIDFKTPFGWIALDLPHMLAVSLQVGDHVQLCFAKEKEVGEAIAGGTISTEADIVAAFTVIPSPGLNP
jgi:hypothetical protein